MLDDQQQLRKAAKRARVDASCSSDDTTSKTNNEEVEAPSCCFVDLNLQPSLTDSEAALKLLTAASRVCAKSAINSTVIAGTPTHAAAGKLTAFHRSFIKTERANNSSSPTFQLISRITVQVLGANDLAVLDLPELSAFTLVAVAPLSDAALVLCVNKLVSGKTSKEYPRAYAAFDIVTMPDPTKCPEVLPVRILPATILSLKSRGVFLEISAGHGSTLLTHNRAINNAAAFVRGASAGRMGKAFRFPNILFCSGATKADRMVTRVQAIEFMLCIGMRERDAVAAYDLSATEVLKRACERRWETCGFVQSIAHK